MYGVTFLSRSKVMITVIVLLRYTVVYPEIDTFWSESAQFKEGVDRSVVWLKPVLDVPLRLTIVYLLIKGHSNLKVTR